MEVIIKLAIVSINWVDGNFYVVLKDGYVPEKICIISESNQPVDEALSIAEKVLTLSKQWMKCSLVNTYVFNDKINIVYKVVIPHDPNIKLNDGAEWQNIIRIILDDQNLINSIEEAVRGIT